MTNLEAINKAMADEQAQANPSSAVLAACAMFKAIAERKRDKTIYREPDMVDPPADEDRKLPWWVEL